MAGFKKLPVRKSIPTDIEGLFKDLARARSAKISNLWAHQADILREYQGLNPQPSDVALELPTGSGKTLVALLIAEFRRRTTEQRILYLCPTKQLAHQVVSQAQIYGIDARAFVGGKKNYLPQDLSSYRRSESIAVGPYHALFNSNPEFEDAQTIILDDAHSAEGALSSLWSVSIPRTAIGGLYGKILGLVEGALPTSSVKVFERGAAGRIRAQVELVPYGAYLDKAEQIREVLDRAAELDRTSGWTYSWNAIRSNLHALGLYVDVDEIFLRPFIYPSLTHKPFSNAQQRIYLSASLGSGGDMERAIGVRRIHRVPTPKTYETRGIGRRFFVFPQARSSSSESDAWVVSRFSDPLTPRTLVISPSNRSAADFRAMVEVGMKRPGGFRGALLTAGDIDDSLEPFTKAKSAILMLSNRYDGIDLPHDTCRQVVILGLPSGTNLQERFLETRIGLESLLAERIRTRILQGAGRCTREDTDYAVVIMSDKRLYDFCARAENRAALHPELRAEITFGLNQELAPPKEYDRLLRWFLEKSPEWNDAEENIAQYRDEVPPRPGAEITTALASSSEVEVDAAYALWNGDWETAVAKSRQVVDRLPGDNLQRYRALWSYFTACSAYGGRTKNSALQGVLDDYLKRGAQASGTISWLSRAARTMATKPAELPIATELEGTAVENICGLLANLGLAGGRFEARMVEIETQLNAKEADTFDRGVVALGTMLGFSAWKPEGKGAPDGVWTLPTHFGLVFEGKSEIKEGGEISIENCRQASGHLTWARNDPDVQHQAHKIVILVPPTTRISREALLHASDTRLLVIENVRELFRQARLSITDARLQCANSQPDLARDVVLRILRRDHLTPEEVVARVTGLRLDSVPAYI